MSSIRTDPVAFDTNEFIFALRGINPHAVILVRERLPELHLFIPFQVQLELQHNISPTEMNEFFDVVAPINLSGTGNDVEEFVHSVPGTAGAAA